jgi:hypothetical protein
MGPSLSRAESLMGGNSSRNTISASLSMARVRSALLLSERKSNPVLTLVATALGHQARALARALFSLPCAGAVDPSMLHGMPGWLALPKWNVSAAAWKCHVLPLTCSRASSFTRRLPYGHQSNLHHH